MARNSPGPRTRNLHSKKSALHTRATRCAHLLQSLLAQLGYSSRLKSQYQAMARSRATELELAAAPPRNGGQKRRMPDTLHHYTERLVAFKPLTNSSDNHIKPHTLLFIRGLGDGLGTVDSVRYRRCS
ncbi:hypothetical protein BJX63DRAFT_276091 [Aspergillus granulosus]|uniref:Uncharacterized protein n=1 Tax=Aspergillus granulosus TaxID=176169 RepID=A0ABR4H7E2_9EURO